MVHSHHFGGVWIVFRRKRTERCVNTFAHDEESLVDRKVVDEVGVARIPSVIPKVEIWLCKLVPLPGDGGGMRRRSEVILRAFPFDHLISGCMGYILCLSLNNPYSITLSAAVKCPDLPLHCVNYARESLITSDLGFKLAIFHTQVRTANSQQKNAQNAVKSVNTTVHEHAHIYTLACDAYGVIHQAYPKGPDLLPLLPHDLHVITLVLGPDRVGQHNKQQS